MLDSRARRLAALLGAGLLVIATSVTAQIRNGQDILDAYPCASLTDGEYIIEPVDGMKIQVYIAGMATRQPEEYITLQNTGDAYNFSTYVPGWGQSQGGLYTTAYTHFTKVRLDPATLMVDVNDRAFASSVGGGFYHGPVQVYSMPYGTAADCYSPYSARGIANINLLGTPFSVAEAEAFVTAGWLPAGSATVAAGRQVVDLRGGGYCGWTWPAGEADSPDLNPVPGAYQLDLAFAGPSVDAPAGAMVVDDGMGGVAYQLPKICVSTAVENLRADVDELDLPGNGLTASLESALESIAAGEDRDAANQLNAFINKVKAQAGKKLTAAQAEELIAAASGIIEELGGRPGGRGNGRAKAAVGLEGASWGQVKETAR